MFFRILPMLAALSILPATAATVTIGSLSTSTGVLVPTVTAVNESTSILVDLSDPTGLAVGSDIAITFSTAQDMIGLGSFDANTGSLTFLWHARLTLETGIFSSIHDVTWVDVFANYVKDPNTSAIVGYSTAPALAQFSLIVPWGTDLSRVAFTLTDLFSINGVNPQIAESSLLMGSFTLTTSSVPEPSTILLGLVGGAGILLRRHRKHAI